MHIPNNLYSNQSVYHPDLYTRNKYGADFHFLARHDFAAYCVAMDPNYQLAQHVEIMCQAIEKIESGEWDRAIVSMPPRHSKTQSWSINFPAWFLGRNPARKVMLVAHTQDLANRMGQMVRNLIDSEAHQSIFPECRLSKDSKAKAAFTTTLGGELYACGILGGASGRGTDCLTGESMIMTDLGEIRIDTLVSLPIPPLVLSFCHETNQLVWRRILATRKVYSSDIYEIKTSGGHSVRCTDNHRFYVPGIGYRPASTLYIGCKARVTQKYSLSNMSKANSSNIALQRMFLQIAKNYHDIALCILSKNLSKATLRLRKGFKKRAQRFLLWESLFICSSCYKKLSQVRNMSSASRKENSAILSELQRKTQRNTKNAARQRMSNLWQQILPTQQSNTVLQPQMCRQSTFNTYDWGWQFSFQRWFKLCFMVCRNATNNFRTRFLSMFGLRARRKDISSFMARSASNTFQPYNPSYRRKSKKQFARKSRSSMFNLSRYTSQVQTDTISSIERICGQSEPVYDIQVEGTNNFFANQILLHNCLIIDDPVKNAEEAMSDVYRKRVTEEYKSTFYTRLEPGGRVVIVSTRWSEADLAGWLLDPHEQEHIEDWHVLSFPAIAEKDEGWRKAGEALWPERWPLDALLRIKSQKGAWDWSAQYQQSPSSVEGMLVKRDWLKTYLWNPHLAASRNMANLMVAPYFIYQSYDTAFEETETSDYSVCTTWLSTNSGEYLLDVWRDKAIAPVLFAKAEELAYYWRPHAILIEKKASGHSLIQMLQAKTKLPIVPCEPQGKKFVRLQAVSPYIQAGRVFLPVQTEWKKDFINELACLEKNTEVVTIEGNKPIYKIQVGELVMTRLGWKRVLQAGCTGKDKLCEILFSNNQRLQVTLNHQIFVPNYGFKNAEALKVGESLLQYIGESHLGYMKASDILQREWMVNIRNSIDMFMSKKLGQFLQNIIFIIKMKTQQIMSLKIWKQFQPQNIIDYIIIKKRGLNQKDIRLSAKTAENNLKGFLINAPFIVLAIALIKPILTGLKFIPNNVKSAINNIWVQKNQYIAINNVVAKDVKENQNCVSFVAKNLVQKLEQLGFVPGGVVVVQVHLLDGIHDVYNLQIEDIPEFVAAGILVHNSFPAGAHDDLVDSTSQYLNWRIQNQDMERRWAINETASENLNPFDR